MWGTSRRVAATKMPTFTRQARSLSGKKRRWQQSMGSSVVKPVGSGEVLSTMGDTTGTQGANADGVYIEQSTSTSANNECYTGASPVYAEWPANSDMLFLCKFSIESNTNSRFFVGVQDLGMPVICDYDDLSISGNAAGISFSPDTRSDTKFQCATCYVSNQLTTATTLTPVTSTIYWVEIEFSGLGTAIRFRLSDKDHNLLCPEVTHTTNLPVATSQMCPIIATQTTTTAAKTHRWYEWEVWN